MPPRVMNSDLGSSADQEHEGSLSGVNGAFWYGIVNNDTSISGGFIQMSHDDFHHFETLVVRSSNTVGACVKKFS